MSKSLTNLDYCAAAKKLKCSVAAIKAVASVESAGDGFLPSGKVKILFERHHFSRLTKRIYDKDYPQISNRQPGGYYGNEKEYQRFNVAFQLNPTAAMKACSWGKFQIMGFNHAVCGFSSVDQFVETMKESEGGQLKAFCGFVDANNLTDKLRRLDWAGFARGYNGTAYKKNQYDTKMARAYAKFVKENINCNALKVSPELPQPTATLNLDEPTELPSETTGEVLANIEPTQTPQTAAPLDNVTVKAESPSLFTKIGAACTALTGLGLNVGALLESKLEQLTPAHIAYLALALGLVALGVWWYRQSANNAQTRNELKAEFAADPERHTVEFE